ncbi:MYND-type domain-containing protein [Mycena chlorophos]|uniref:phytol kinase n=1 Tax=Mycena chlorophos TaxID=658473 RepID=A0A8H6TS01_MYCCL|nr:MYND-type domain-containing protein [Mycena chlorophos]
MQRVFQPSRLSGLPTDIASLARNVVRGDLTALPPLILAARGMPAATAELLLPVHYYVLDPVHMRTMSVNDWESDAAAIHSRLSAVITTFEPLQLAAMEARIPKSAMSDIFNRVWLWVQFLQDYREQITPAALGQPYVVCMTFFAELFYAFCTSEEYSREAHMFAVSNPRIHFILSSTLDELLDQEAADQRCGKFASHASYGVHAAAWSLFYYGHQLLLKDTPHFQHLLVGTGGTWDHLALFLRRYLEQSLATLQSQDAPTVFQLERVYAALLFMPGVVEPGRSPRPELRAALIRHGAITLFTKLLAPARTHPAANPPRPAPPKALRAGFLCVLLEFARAPGYYRSTAKEHIQFSLNSGIAQHCVYLSVLRALRVALEELVPFDPQRVFEEAGFSSDWIQFLGFMQDRLRIVDEYDAGRLMMWRVCDNTECGLVGPKAQFKQCTGCSEVWYCSRACQKANWRWGHRQECSIIAQDRDNDHAILSPGDRSFQRAMLNYDYAIEQVKITTKFLPVTASTGAQRCAVMFDYLCGGAPRIETSSITQKQRSEHSRLNALWTRADASPGRAQLSMMHFVQGKEVQRRVVLLRFSNAALANAVKQIPFYHDAVSEHNIYAPEVTQLVELLIKSGYAGIWTH